MDIEMKPRMMTCLQLFASCGEMLCPFLMGIAFQFKYFFLFGGLMLGWQTLVLALLFLAWLYLTRRLAAMWTFICCIGR